MSSNIPKESTVEGLIDGLDRRGLLVFQVLLGQQAMKLLTEEKMAETPKVLPKTSLLLPSNNVT